MKYLPFFVFLCAMGLPLGASAQGTINFSPDLPVLRVIWPGPGEPFCDYAQYVTLQSTSPDAVSFSSSQFQTNVYHGAYASTLTIYLKGTVNEFVCDQTGGHFQVLTANCPLSPATLPANGTCQTIVTFAGSEYGMWSGSITVSGTAESQPPVPISGTIYPTAYLNP